MTQTIEEPSKQRGLVVTPLIEAVPLHIGNMPVRLAAAATLHRRQRVVPEPGTVSTIRSSGHTDVMLDPVGRYESRAAGTATVGTVTASGRSALFAMD